MKLDFVSAGAAHGLVAAGAEARGVEVQGSFGAVGAMLEKFTGGAPCDVVILTHAQVIALVAERAVESASFSDLGSVATSIAVRAGDNVPDIGDDEALRIALLAAETIHFPDPAKATAGIHFAKVIGQLGLGEALASRTRTFPNGATAMRAMVDAPGRAIGCTQATEILATVGARLVGPLPRGLHLDTVYTAAVSAKSPRADEAREFVGLLAGKAFRRARQDAGFGGVAVRPAKAADSAAVRELVFDILREYGIASDPVGTDLDLADLDAGYGARGGHFDVAVAPDGRIVGSCGVRPLAGGAFDLRKMYVHRDWRGQGLGRRLLQRALAVARASGAKRIELETASVLKEAIELYTRSGFTALERDPLAKRCDKSFALDL